MNIPAIQGVIDRRILANFRVDPKVAQTMLPAPFRPKLAHGYAMAGICLIRLKGIRPARVPWMPGIGSENAAHRFAVEWDEGGQIRQGVFIPRRDTSSRVNALLGGRLFPGIHHHARFHAEENEGHIQLSMQSDDREVAIDISAAIAKELPRQSVFKSLDEASQFFQQGALGYSTTADPRRFDGLELDCENWSVQPLEVEHIASSFFDDPKRFPPGAAVFDCALLMRGIRHVWRGKDNLCCDMATTSR